MARKPESLFRERAQKDIKTLPNTVDFSIQQIAKHGDPDKILCIRGLFVAIEMKTDIGKLTPLQAHVLGKIRAAGGFGIVARPATWKVIFEWLEVLATVDGSVRDVLSNMNQHTK